MAFDVVKTNLAKLAIVACWGGGLIALMLVTRGVLGFLFVTEKTGQFIPTLTGAPTQVVAPADAETPAPPSERQQALATLSASAGFFRTQSAMVNQSLRTGRVELWLDRAREASRTNPGLYPTEGHFLLEQLGAWGATVQTATRYQAQPNAATMEVYQRQVEAANQGAPAPAQLVMPTVNAVKTDADTAGRFRQSEANFLDVLQALQEWSNAGTQVTPRARTQEVDSTQYNQAIGAVTAAAYRVINRPLGQGEQK